MSEAAHELRAWLMERGGHAEVPVSRLAGRWDATSRAEHADRLTRELGEAGVVVDPPLDACGPDTMIRVSVLSTATPEPAASAVLRLEPEPEPTTAPEIDGSSVDVSVTAPPPESDRRPRWSVRQLLGGRRTASIAAGAIGAVIVVVGAFVVLDGDDSSSGARKAFCESDAGRALNDAEVVGRDATYSPTGGDARLREATDSALREAASAPAGADCAVFALKSLADGWRAASGVPAAGEQVARIRALQRDKDLESATF